MGICQWLCWTPCWKVVLPHGELQESSSWEALAERMLFLMASTPSCSQGEKGFSGQECRYPPLPFSLLSPPEPQVLTASLVPICFPVPVGAQSCPGKVSFHARSLRGVKSKRGVNNTSSGQHREAEPWKHCSVKIERGCWQQEVSGTDKDGSEWWELGLFY